MRASTISMVLNEINALLAELPVSVAGWLSTFDPANVGGVKFQLPSPAWLVWRFASNPTRPILLISTAPFNSGSKRISNSTCLNVSISGCLAQEALLKATCSALTLITGKILKLTGPVIFNSRPVASLTVELSSFVTCWGLIKDDAYHAPKHSRVMQPTTAMRVILRVLFTQSF